MTEAVVLVPTHDAAHTLDVAVESALAQTVEDIEVVVIGDGVTDAVREVAHDLLRRDPRVRFLDRPKAPHHGEVYRDEVIRTTTAPVVCYLCDDDLLLPEHVETMVALLADADLAQSLNGTIDRSGRWVPCVSDLSSPTFRRWLEHPARNSVSVTGTAHTTTVYRRLPVGWEPPPPGRWTDHVMWQKLLALPDVRAVTSAHVTAIQLPTHLDGRAELSGAERRAELLAWRDTLRTPEGRAALDTQVRDELNRWAAELLAVRDVFADRAAELTARCAELEALAGALRAERDDLAHRLSLVEGSRTWRLRRRVVRGPLRRFVRR